MEPCRLVPAPLRYGSMKRSQALECVHENHRYQNLLLPRRRPQVLHRQGGNRRRHSRPRRGRHRPLGRRHRSSRAAPGGNRRRRGSLRHGAPVATHVPGRLLPRRQGVRLRHQRHRHRALGHQGQGIGNARVPTTRRPGARQGRVLSARPGSNAGRIARQLRGGGGGGLEVPALASAHRGGTQPEDCSTQASPSTSRWSTWQRCAKQWASASASA